MRFTAGRVWLPMFLSNPTARAKCLLPRVVGSAEKSKAHANEL
jgi:hypothetical protein